jgi:hypothetical protein
MIIPLRQKCAQFLTPLCAVCRAKAANPGIASATLASRAELILLVPREGPMLMMVTANRA